MVSQWRASGGPDGRHSKVRSGTVRTICSNSGGRLFPHHQDRVRAVDVPKSVLPTFNLLLALADYGELLKYEYDLRSSSREKMTISK
jgi:hypothetical protein